MRLLSFSLFGAVLAVGCAAEPEPRGAARTTPAAAPRRAAPPPAADLDKPVVYRCSEAAFDAVDKARTSRGGAKTLSAEEFGRLSQRAGLAECRKAPEPVVPRRQDPPAEESRTRARVSVPVGGGIGVGVEVSGFMCVTFYVTITVPGGKTKKVPKKVCKPKPRPRPAAMRPPARRPPAMRPPARR